MSTSKIQTGDIVKVISGAYKSHIGQVVKVQKFTTRTNKVINQRTRVQVAGLPTIVKYRKAYKFAGQAGQKLAINRWIDVSNVALFTDSGKISRVKIVMDENGNKNRVLAKNGEIVSKTPVVKEKKTETAEKQLA